MINSMLPAMMMIALDRRDRRGNNDPQIANRVTRNGEVVLVSASNSSSTRRQSLATALLPSFMPGTPATRAAVGVVLANRDNRRIAQRETELVAETVAARDHIHSSRTREMGREELGRLPQLSQNPALLEIVVGPLPNQIHAGSQENHEDPTDAKHESSSGDDSNGGHNDQVPTKQLLAAITALDASINRLAGQLPQTKPVPVVAPTEAEASGTKPQKQ